MSVLGSLIEGALAAVGMAGLAWLLWGRRAGLLAHWQRSVRAGQDVLQHLLNKQREPVMLRRLADRAALSRNRELEAALIRYGLHLSECALSVAGRVPYGPSQVECTCGYWLTLHPPPEWSEAGTRNGFAFVDPSGVIRFISDWLSVISGYAREDLIGQHVRFLIPKRFHPQHARWERDYFANPVVRPMGGPLSHVVLLNREQREVPVDLGLYPMREKRIDGEGSDPDAEKQATWVLVILRLRPERWF